MQIINIINQISPDMTWEEFIAKFLLTVLIIMPVSILGVTFITYNLVHGNTGTLESTIAIASASILGGIIGFTLTLLTIKAGHKINK